MNRSDRVRTDESGIVFARSQDGEEVRLAGIGRMHFFRLAGATPEEATDEQVDRYFTLRSEEERSGQRATEVLRNESATDMVTRELGIFNLPQVLGNDDVAGAGMSAPNMPTLPPTTTALTPTSPPAQGVGTTQQAVDPTRRRTATGGLPPAPRYVPSAAPSTGATPPSPAATAQIPPTNEDAPQSAYVRRDGVVLYLQSPDGSEQRVTQYIRTHFLQMIERDITVATDQDIEMWFKLQGSLEAGTTLQEARSRNLLTEALQAAGKLNRADLEVLQQSINAWIDARRDAASS